MNEVEKNNELLILLGLSLFQAQSLEYSIITLFALNKVLTDGQWTIEVRNLMDSKFKHTLGKLIKDVSRKIEFDSNLLTNLNKALKLRNWLVHKFFKEYGHSGSSDKLRSKAIKELKAAASFFEDMSDEITSINIGLMKQCGRTNDDINKGVNRAINYYLSTVET